MMWEKRAVIHAGASVFFAFATIVFFFFFSIDGRDYINGYLMICSLYILETAGYLISSP